MTPGNKYSSRQRKLALIVPVAAVILFAIGYYGHNFAGWW